MRLSLSKRVKKLEALRTDATGLRRHSEPWFAFWEDKLERLWAGEDIGNLRIPIEVTDRIIEAADLEETRHGSMTNSGHQGCKSALTGVVERPDTDYSP